MKLSLIVVLLAVFFISTQKSDVKERSDPAIQLNALQVLNQKCNICHATRNPSKLFTLENMNDFVSKINRQVFVWKRMPKGKEIKLTDQEKQILKKWIIQQ